MSSEPRTRLRVVLDSNVLVSALGFQKRTAAIWELVEDGHFDLFVSDAILDEVERVLVLKAGMAPERALDVVEGIASLARAVVFPERRLSVVKADDTDNAVLECAVEAQVDVLVTGDLKHLRPIGSFRGIAILSPREFLDKYFPAT